MSYNIWAAAKTRNGLAADEVISTLQKSIRRNKVEEACQAAYELYITGPLFLDKLWRRLLTISVEDIGFGNLQAAVQVNTLNEVRKSYAYDDGDQPMYFIHAIRLLCASTKDRSSDYLKNIIIKEAAMGKSWKFQISPWINTLNVDKKWDEDQNTSLKREQRSFLN